MTSYPASTHGVDPVAESGATRATPRETEVVDVTNRLADTSLLVVAQREIGRAIEDALAEAPSVVRTVERPPSAGPAVDPATIREVLASHGPVDGVLLSVSRDADIAAMPGPLVDGVPVGVVRADTPNGLAQWLDAVRPPLSHAPTWAVLAMGTDEFLEPAGALRRNLHAAACEAPVDVEVRDWRADRVDRTALCRRLATGPALAVYLGHGRCSGWVGYQALRWKHVSAVPHRGPIGAVVALTCDALAEPPAATAPFLERFVRTGRAGAAVGPVDDVRTDVLEQVSTPLGTILREVAPATIGDLLRAVDRRASPASLDEHLRSYRLVGLPLQPIR